MIRLGVDFGTTNSSIAAWKTEGDKVKSYLFPLTKEGDVVIPTQIALGPNDQKAYGHDVQDFLNQYPNALVIRNIKKYLGTDKKFEYDGYQYTVSELVGYFLAYLFRKAKEADSRTDYIKGYSGVIVGVPVASMDAAKNDLLEACLSARLARKAEEVTFVAEPVAAAISYGVEFEAREKVLVFDFGGGTLDITIVEMNPDLKLKLDKPKVLAKVGEDIGGSSIDYTILKELLVPYIGPKKILRELKVNFLESLDQSAPGYHFMKLIETGKKELSTEESYNFVYNFERLSVDETLKRNEFERELGSILEMITRLIQQALQNADQGRSLSPRQINRVIMAGGSSLIPCIQVKLQEVFGDKVEVSNRALTCITEGLAMIAYYTSQEEPSHDDITDFDYGFFDDKRQEMVVLIEAGTPYPIATEWQSKKAEMIDQTGDFIILRIMGRRPGKKESELRKVRISNLERAMAKNRFDIQFRVNPEQGVLEFRVFDNWESRYVQPENNIVPLDIPG